MDRQKTFKQFITEGNEIITDSIIQTTASYLPQGAKDIINNKFLFEYGKKVLYDSDVDTVHQMVSYILGKNFLEYQNLNATLNKQFDLTYREKITLKQTGTVDVDLTTDNELTDTFNLSDAQTKNLTDETTYGKQNQRTDNLTDLRTDALQQQRTDNLTQQRTDNLTEQRTDDLESVRTDNTTTTNRPAKVTTESGSDTSIESTKPFDNNNFVETTKEVTQPGRITTESGTDTTTDTGTVTTTNDGTQTTTNTGTQSTTNTGTQTEAQTGTQTNAHTGTQTNTESGKDTLKHTGTDTLLKTGTKKTDDLKDENEKTTYNKTDERKYEGLPMLDDLEKLRLYFKTNLYEKIVADLLNVLALKTWSFCWYDL